MSHYERTTTSQVDQLKKDLEEAVENLKPLVETEGMTPATLLLMGSALIEVLGLIAVNLGVIADKA